MGFIGAVHRLGGRGGVQKAPLPKICHTYPTMIKLGTVIPYLKMIQKYMNHVTHSLSSADFSIFHWKSAIVNTDVDFIFIHNF